MNIPDQLTQGTTRTWKDGVQYDDLNAEITSADHTLTYSLIGPVAVNGKFGVALVATPDGSGWITTITTAQSTDLIGLYTWVAWVQKGADATTKFQVGSGELTVIQDITLIDPATSGYDGRTQLEKDLAAVDAAISARASGGTPYKYTIGSRQLENEPMSTLVSLRNDLQRRLVKMRQQNSILNGDGDPRTITMRFRSPH